MFFNCFSSISVVKFCFLIFLITDSIKANNVTLSLEAEINAHNNLTKMSYKVDPLPNSFADLGEGPHWDIETQSLYFVDINNAEIFRYDYNENKVYKCRIPNAEKVGFIIPVEKSKNQFLVGTGRDVSVIEWNGTTSTCKLEKILFNVEKEKEKYESNRFNDAKCDPYGRLYAGTMRDVGDIFEHRYGHLYRYSTGGKINVLKDNIGVSNGLVWNEKENKFYYIDTADFEIKEYDWDPETGDIKNPKVLIDLRETIDRPKLLPDGMTIDIEGFLYVATFGGSSVLKINPKTGSIEMTIKLPCEKITSCCFGGPNLDILYVTSAVQDKNVKSGPAGTTYKVTGLGAKGLPMTKAKLF